MMIRVDMIENSKDLTRYTYPSIGQRTSHIRRDVNSCDEERTLYTI